MTPRAEHPAARAPQHPGQQARLDTLSRTPYRHHQVPPPAPARRPSPQSLPRDHGEGRCHRLHGHGDAVHHPVSREPAESPRSTPLTTQAGPVVDTYNVAGHLWKLTYKWACWSHPDKPRHWIIGRYFGKFSKFRNDRWVFGDKDTGAYR